VRVLADGDLALLHGFEQGACTLAGARLISSASTRLAKMGPRRGVKVPSFGMIDHGADDIGGQKVRRELDALELGLQSARQRAHGERLGQAGNAFEQHVAIGQQSHEQAVHQIRLPHEHAGDFRCAAAPPRRMLWRVAVITEKRPGDVPESEPSPEEARPSLMHSVFVPVEAAAALSPA
jgi:hypothetical protein